MGRAKRIIRINDLGFNLTWQLTPDFDDDCVVDIMVELWSIKSGYDIPRLGVE